MRYMAGFFRSAMDLSRRRGPSWLILSGALLSLLYAWYALVLPQIPARLERPASQLMRKWEGWSWVRSGSLPVPQDGWEVMLGVLLSAVGAFFLYGAALLVVWGKTGRGWVVTAVGGSLLFSSIFVLSMPNLNTDLYNYVLRGRVKAVYGANPYTTPADAFPQDPLYPFASHRHTGEGSGKLPAWMWWNVAWARLAGDEPVRVLFTYRLSFWLLHLGNLLLIGLLMARVRPSWLATALVAYGWHPVVLVFSQHKTDALMVLFLLLGVWLLRDGKRLGGTLALGCSVLVKLFTAPLLVVYFLSLLRRGEGRQLLLCLLALLLLGLVLYAPFWEGPELLRKHLGLVAGVPGTPHPVPFPWLWRGLGVGLVLWAGWTPVKDREEMILRWVLVMGYLGLFLVHLGLSHYLLPLLALASLIPAGGITLVVSSLSFSAFLFNAWYWASSADFPLPDLLPWSRGLVYLAPPAAAAAAWYFSRIKQGNPVQTLPIKGGWIKP